MPAPTHPHPRHPDVPPRWHSLNPSFPSGTAFHCTVVVGTWTRPDGTLREILCDEGYVEPTERCRCEPGNHGVRFTGNPYQPVMANRTIWAGKCSGCGEIVPGHEEEADSDSSNW